MDDLGDQAGFHRSNASRSIQWLIDVLLLALKKLDVLPAREFASPAELEAAFAGIEELLIDATERPTLRPQDEAPKKKLTAARNISTRSKIRSFPACADKSSFSVTPFAAVAMIMVFSKANFPLQPSCPLQPTGLPSSRFGSI